MEENWVKIFEDFFSSGKEFDTFFDGYELARKIEKNNYGFYTCRG